MDDVFLAGTFVRLISLVSGKKTPLRNVKMSLCLSRHADFKAQNIVRNVYFRGGNVQSSGQIWPAAPFNPTRRQLVQNGGLM